MKRKFSFLALFSFLIISLLACETIGLPVETSQEEEGRDLSAIIAVEKQSNNQSSSQAFADEEDAPSVIEGEDYYDKDAVAEYIHVYGELPPNYITKEEADDMGWSVEDNDGYVIGGNRFGNREGLLPEEDGRQYFEADLIDGYTSHRGPQRLVYSNDGLIFFSDDHYSSFTQLYQKGGQMRYYILFGECFTSRENTYAYLQRVFGFPDTFGNNLDALWDSLTDLKGSEIQIVNARNIIEEMGDYGMKILNVFGDLAQEGYCNVTINW